VATTDVFEPALCCNTGVCGEDLDRALVSFSADLDWATANGGQVTMARLVVDRATPPISAARQLHTAR
jgi:hypothetical protein